MSMKINSPQGYTQAQNHLQSIHSHSVQISMKISGKNKTTVSMTIKNRTTATSLQLLYLILYKAKFSKQHSGKVWHTHDERTTASEDRSYSCDKQCLL